MEPVYEQLVLNFTQSLTSRQNTLRAMRSDNFKASGNLFSNRQRILNCNRELEWLNKSLESYKTTFKKFFLAEDKTK